MDQFVKEWLRYLDDCFLNWDLKIDTTENLLKILHSLHPSIKFENEEKQNRSKLSRHQNSCQRQQNHHLSI